MEIIIRLCDLCYDNGDYKDAIAEYTDTEGETHEICVDCEKIVKQVGLLSRALRPNEVTIAEIVDAMQK